MIDTVDTNLPQRIFDVEVLPPVNDGQRELFGLICRRLKEKAIVQHREILFIYQTYVQESEYSSAGYFDEEQDKWIENFRKYKDWEIEALCNAWLLRALGTLIKKGYLTVIPQIQFAELPEK
jgi:hypothetical protein